LPNPHPREMMLPPFTTRVGPSFTPGPMTFSLRRSHKLIGFCRSAKVMIPLRWACSRPLEWLGLPPAKIRPPASAAYVLNSRSCPLRQESLPVCGNGIPTRSPYPPPHTIWWPCRLIDITRVNFFLHPISWYCRS